MITINDNAYIKADKYCLYLYIKRDVVSEKNGKHRKFMLQGYFGNLNAALDGYIDYLHHESAMSKTTIDIQQLVNLSMELKNNLSKQFNLVSRTNFPIDNLCHKKGSPSTRHKTPP